MIFFKLYVVYFNIGRLGIKILAFSLTNCTVNVWAFWIFFAYVYVYSHVWGQACKCMYTCVYVHVETKGCFRVSLSVVLHGICWVKAPLPSEFTKLIYLPGFSCGSVFVSRVLRFQPGLYTHCLRGSWGFKRWSSCYGSTTLSTEPSPQKLGCTDLNSSQNFLIFHELLFCSLLLVIYKMWVFSVQIHASFKWATSSHAFLFQKCYPVMLFSYIKTETAVD